MLRRACGGLGLLVVACRRGPDAEVSFRTWPADAVITLDGEPVAQPVKRAAGQYTFEVHRPGFGVNAFTLDLGAGDLRMRESRLRPLESPEPLGQGDAELVLDAPGSVAEGRLDGTPIGRMPARRRMPAGRHHVRLTRPDGTALDVDVPMEAGTRCALYAGPAPRKLSLAVAAAPGRVVESVDGAGNATALGTGSVDVLVDPVDPLTLRVRDGDGGAPVTRTFHPRPCVRFVWQP